MIPQRKDSAMVPQFIQTTPDMKRTRPSLDYQFAKKHPINPKMGPDAYVKRMK